MKDLVQKNTHQSQQRITSIDYMRGFVMVLMVLDHVRYSYAVRAIEMWGTTSSLYPMHPTQALHETSALLFYLRWITNFCAPVFVFLAGVSIFLWIHKKGRLPSVSKYLLVRGSWVICANFIVALPTPLLFPPSLTLGVLWAIGLSMICMGGLVHLPKTILWILGIVCVSLSSVLTGISFSNTFLYEFYVIAFQHKQLAFSSGATVYVMYPFVPWLGLMLLGYLSGDIFLKKDRVKVFLYVGLALLTSFALLRYFNFYGDSEPWLYSPVTWQTVASFFNTTKYPPSFLFVLFNIGVLFVSLAFVERFKLNSKLLITLGSTPMLFYITHFWAARAMGIVVEKYSGPFDITIKSLLLTPAGVFISSILLVLILYPLCWFWKYRTMPWSAKI